MRLRLMILGVVALLSAHSAEGQTQTGTVIGTIRDQSRAVLPGVTVTVTSPAMPGRQMTAVADERGEYRIADLNPGTYHLRASLQGFSTYEESDLRVFVSGTIERNITLPVATVAETVNLSGQAPVVDPREAGIAANITLEITDNVPTTRMGVAGFLGTLPGVTLTSYNKTATPQVMGSASNEFSYYSDGVMYNSVGSGGGYNFGDIDSIEEINVQLLGASAEYQQAQGGVMNAVSKSGTNSFRGDALAYWQPSNLIAVPFTLPCGCPEGNTGFKNYIWRDYSAHGGGPIKRDRLWFYTGYVSVGFFNRNAGSPSVPEQYQWNRYDARTNSKITWKINAKMAFTQAFYYEYWKYTYPEFPTIATPLAALRWYPGDIRDGSSELISTLSPSTALTVKYTFHSMPYGDTGWGPSLSKFDITTPSHYDLATGFTSANMNQAADSILPRRDDFAVKMNQYFSGHSVTQNVRYGIQAYRSRETDLTHWAGGVQYLDLNGKPDEASYSGPSTASGLSHNVGVWAEDEINIGQRATIIPAFRWDHMKAISPDSPTFDPTTLVPNGTFLVKFYTFRQTGSAPGLGDMFTWNRAAPRLGFNYKVTTDAKTILRATAGRYYRPLFLTDFLNVHPGIATVTLKQFNPATNDYTTLVSVTDPKANIKVDPNIRPPYTDQYSIGIDREVAKSTAASVSYVHKYTTDLIGWQDIGGIYGTGTATAPDGTIVTTHPLLNGSTSQLFLRTNNPRFFNRYNGVILSLTKRLANNWTAMTGYSYGIVTGLSPTGNTGSDPNDLTNLTGDLPTARRKEFTASGTYQIPKIGVQVSGNLAIISGIPYGAQVNVRLPQGLRAIYFQPPGTYLTPNESWLHFRISKIMFRHAGRNLELTAEVRNALNNTSVADITSRIYGTTTFGQPSQFAYPRQLLFMARVHF